MTYSKVLVPLDGADEAVVLLPHLVELVARAEAEVILLKILPETGVLPTTAHQEYNDARRHLDAMAQKLKSQGIKVSTTIRFGRPAEEIVDYAQTNGVRLIVMCAPGHRGLRRRVFGNGAEKVLRSTSLPMFIIRAPEVSIDKLAVLAEEVRGQAATQPW